MTSGWEETTAIATILLAAVTAGLAWSTRRLAREAGAETRANWLPLVVLESEGTAGLLGAPPNVTHDPGDGTISIVLRNIGRGPALNVTATIARDEEADWELRGAFARGRSDSDVLAPSGRLEMRWKGFETPASPEMPDFLLIPRSGVITYWDITYTRHETFIQLGFGNDGRAVLTEQRYVGDARKVTSWERLVWRIKWRKLEWGKRLRQWLSREPLPKSLSERLEELDSQEPDESATSRTARPPDDEGSQ